MKYLKFELGNFSLLAFKVLEADLYVFINDIGSIGECVWIELFIFYSMFLMIVSTTSPSAPRLVGRKSTVSVYPSTIKW